MNNVEKYFQCYFCQSRRTFVGQKLKGFFNESGNLLKGDVGVNVIAEGIKIVDGKLQEKLE